MFQNVRFGSSSWVLCEPSGSMDLLGSAPLVNAAGEPVAASSLKGLLVAFYFSVSHTRDLAATGLASLAAQAQ